MLSNVQRPSKGYSMIGIELSRVRYKLMVVETESTHMVGEDMVSFLRKLRQSSTLLLVTGNLVA